MIVSNEPGFYKPGSFGIRIENLVAVVEKETPSQFGGVKYLGMESLTMVSYLHLLVPSPACQVCILAVRFVRLIRARLRNGVRRFLVPNRYQLDRRQPTLVR